LEQERSVRTKSPLQAEKILCAAAELFARHRFHEARMEDIALAAGVGKGTLYRYFQDKDELYEALLAQAAEEVCQRLRESPCCSREPRARLEAIVGLTINYFDEQPHLFDLINHAEAMNRIAPGSPWQRARDEFLHQLRLVFEEGSAIGSFFIRDPDVAIHMLAGGLRNVVRFGSRPRPANLVARIVDGFLYGAAETTCADHAALRRRAGASG
jgi:TetR/AcrR family fatty acid metabolism transcriptional regulator